MLRPALALLCLTGWVTPARAQPLLTGIGVPAGYDGSALWALSADGQVAVGQMGIFNLTHAARWTAAGGLQDLGTLTGEIRGVAGGVTADGGTAFGYVMGSQTTTSKPFRWTAATGMTNLGVPAGYFGAQAWRASADGTAAAAVGVLSNGYRALRWTAAGGFQTLPMPVGAGDSFGQGISPDGGTVVGQYATAGGEQAFRWTPAGGTEPLPGQPNGFSSDNVAFAASPGGAVVVGSSQAGLAPQPKVPFRWSAADGFQTLPLLPGHTNGTANAVSADGGVVVGLGGTTGTTDAWVFDFSGLRDLNAAAVAQGVDLTGWRLVEANAIVGGAPAGYTIAGTGLHNGVREGYVLSGLQLTPVPEPSALVLVGVAAAGLAMSRFGRRGRGPARRPES